MYVCMYICMCMCIYIYIYIYVDRCVYIYIYMLYRITLYCIVLHDIIRITLFWDERLLQVYQAAAVPAVRIYNNTNN